MADENVSSSQALLAEAEKLSHTGAWQWDLVRNQWTFSDGWLSIHGCEKRTLSRDELLAIAHPDDRAQMARAFEDVRNGAGPYSVEHRIIRQDTGEVRVIKAYGQLVRDASGMPTSVLGAAQDVTEAKEAEYALRRARDELEARVAERTEELREANRVLHAEIVEHKLAQEAVEAERQRFNEVLDMLPAYLVLLSPDYHVPFANRFFRERFGESQGQRCFEYLFGRTEPCEICETYKVLKTLAPLEWEWTGPDGRNYQIFDFPFPDRDGSTLIMEVGIDITERKRAEEALRKAHDELEMRVQERTRELRESEEKYRKIVETANEGIWVSDTAGRATFANQRMADMLGYSREEMIGRTGAEFLVEGQESTVAETRGELGKGGRIQREYQFRRKGGTPIWMLTNASAIFDEQGRHIANLFMHTDITERKQAEQELRETRDYLNNLLDYANAPIIVWGPSFRVTRFNHAFERLTGLKSSDVLGKRLDILFPEDRREESMSHIRRAAAGERWEVVEIPILRTDGSVRTVLWNSATLYAPDGNTVVATIAQGQDITERKQAGEEIIRLNEALRERAAELEASNKELESFSYSVSHDLREPLRTIDGFSRILQKDYSERLDAEAQRLIGIIRGGTAKMDVLISNLLSFSRIGRKQMELSGIDMGELARAVAEEVRSAVSERKLRFSIRRLPAARGDPAMIRQVMVNLLGNAVKFTRSKRLAVIEVGSFVEGDENVYYVKDNGVGFDPQYKDKLFSIFQRLHSEEEFEGTGVGLAIVQRIVYRHGGRVWAEGKVGRGATFYFTLPRKGGKP